MDAFLEQILEVFLIKYIKEYLIASQYLFLEDFLLGALKIKLCKCWEHHQKIFLETFHREFPTEYLAKFLMETPEKFTKLQLYKIVKESLEEFPKNHCRNAWKHMRLNTYNHKHHLNSLSWVDCYMCLNFPGLLSISHFWRKHIAFPKHLVYETGKIILKISSEILLQIYGIILWKFL